MANSVGPAFVWPPFPVSASCKEPVVQTFQGVTLETFDIDGVGDLRALAALDENVAWVGGTQGRIAKTDDGGRSWSSYHIAGAEQLDFRALCICNPGTVCAMSAGSADKALSRVYRTVNGGKHWDLVLFPKETDIFFNAMVFWDANHGILLGDPLEDRFVLFRTEDAGATWERLNPTEMPFAFKGEKVFAASNSCLAVQGSKNVWFATGGGELARVFCSADRGDHWTVVETPMQLSSPSSGIFSLAFSDRDTGIAVGGDYCSPTGGPQSNIIVTNNGGTSWQPLSDASLARRYLSSVAWIRDSRVVVVDESVDPFHSVAIAGGCGWAVGASKMC
ncbi:MAG: hypothetical protein KDK44_01055, partial [Chlamydiia bacterium]|nr:hypothetical protein [Chlamydiia bacterium]